MTTTTTIYTKAFEELVDQLFDSGIEITEVKPWFDGYIVKFSGYDGDAACHMGTYGGPAGYWETYGMPWDGSDVTGWLSTERLVAALITGELPDECDEE